MIMTTIYHIKPIISMTHSFVLLHFISFRLLAAHTIHPMAGQGLNLGMADAECLARHIQRSVQSGMGIKDKAGLQYALQQYESERQREVVSVMGGIQVLHTMFGTTFSPAVHIRSVGMNLINSLGPMRRKLVKVATGENGVFEKDKL